MDLRTLSVREAAEATGFSRDRIYELVKAQAVAVIRSGGAVKPRIRIIASSLEDWMRRHTTPAKYAPTAAPHYDADHDLAIGGAPRFS